MRVALTVLVVAALVFVGFRAGSRMLDRQEEGSDRTDPEQVAESWVAATNTGDVDGLADLAAERTDTELLRSTYGEVLPALGQWEATVAAVAVDGNRADATLAWAA